jgi:hypothetical protein
MMNVDQASPLLTTLASSGDLNPNNIRMLSGFMREWGVSAFDALIETKIFSEGRLADLISEHFGYMRMNGDDMRALDTSVVNTIPYIDARRLSCIVLSTSKKGECNNFRVAMSDPTNVQYMDQIKSLLGDEFIPVVSTRSEIQQSLNIAYAPEDQFGSN